MLFHSNLQQSCDLAVLSYAYNIMCSDIIHGLVGLFCFGEIIEFSHAALCYSMYSVGRVKYMCVSIICKHWLGSIVLTREVQ